MFAVPMEFLVGTVQLLGYFTSFENCNSPLSISVFIVNKAGREGGVSMCKQLQYFSIIPGIVFAFFLSTALAEVQEPATSGNTDKQVQQFLDSHRWSWRDANVPEVDGKALHDIILEHGYKNALEIGTSTGHSTVWIAWALSKTGGKLITVEIDKYKYDQALAHFKEAGVAKYIDARLGACPRIRV
jgi:hypothetical protein